MPTKAFAAFVTCALAASSVSAALTPPIVEDFEDGASGWTSNIFQGATAVASGGWDGGAYISTQYSPVGITPGSEEDTFAVTHRGETGSSEGRFAGNWIADGVTEFSFWFRHNLPSPVNVFARFSPIQRFPGGVAVEFQPVFSNTWTEISFSIDPNSPNFVSFEGQPAAVAFPSIFSNLSNIQIGFDVPAAFAGSPQNFTIDVDDIRATPAPASAVALLGALGVARRRRG